MMIKRRVLAGSAAALGLALLLGGASVASSAPKGDFKPPRPNVHAPKILPPPVPVVPADGLRVAASGEDQLVAPDYEALGRQIGLSSDQAKAFAERSRAANATPVQGATPPSIPRVANP